MELHVQRATRRRAEVPSQTLEDRQQRLVEACLSIITLLLGTSRVLQPSVDERLLPLPVASRSTDETQLLRLRLG